uniref:Dirigent protein n=1 Tax=Chenopodium quinoa TaxID=63459 RepID=A0A803KVB4_CHEQI
MVYYFHDVLYNGKNAKNATSAIIGAPAWANKTILARQNHFGDFIVFDNPTTLTNDFHSTQVGRAQGFYFYDKKDVFTSWFGFSFVFNSTKHKGSLNFAGANPSTKKTRDISVIGGTVTSSWLGVLLPLRLMLLKTMFIIDFVLILSSMNVGTKFNARKEDIEKTYLGIKCFRFYFNCTNCSAEIVKKTDPQNSDYVIEAGATRLFEHCRIREDVESEDTGDVMKGLETRMLESKREMDLLARVEELKSVQARRGGVSVDTLLEELRRRGEEKMVDEEDDEALVKSMFGARSEKDKQKVSEVDSSKFVTSDVKQPVLQSKAPAVRFMVTRKRVQKSGGDSDAVKKEDTASGLQSLCHYDSEDE